MNDIYDIDALALATPYCDVVVTEKACHHILSTAKMAERMNTSLLHRLADLPAVLRVGSRSACIPHASCKATSAVTACICLDESRSDLDLSALTGRKIGIDKRP